MLETGVIELRRASVRFGYRVVRELQETVRPDLRLVVMSATVATQALARYLPAAVVVTSEGRAHPVEIEYLPVNKGQRIEEATANAVLRAKRLHVGDILAFLPGAGEIHRVAEMLNGALALEIGRAHV